MCKGRVATYVPVSEGPVGGAPTKIFAIFVLWLDPGFLKPEAALLRNYSLTLQMGA